MKKFVAWAKALPIAPLSLTFLGATLWPEMELLVPSLPYMKEHFQVSEGQIQQVLSINFIGFILGVLIMGPLCDSLGRKKISIYGALVFLLASATAAIIDNFSVLMTMRFIQGIVVTAPIIGGSTMLLEMTSGHRQIFWMSISSSVITLCMAGAPLIGASINKSFGYQGNLWAIFIAALLGILPVIFWVKETLAPQNKSAFNIRSMAQSYCSLLANKRFMIMAIAISGMPAAYWVYTGVSSLYLVDFLKVDAELFGNYQGPIVGTFALLSIFISPIHRKLGLKMCLTLGFVLMFFGASTLLYLAILGVDNALYTTMFMMLFVGGMVPANALLFPKALGLLPSKLQGSGQSLMQAIRLLIASLGTMSMGIFYHGPFLPVAIILFVLFVASWALLFSQRRNLKGEAAIYASGH